MPDRRPVVQARGIVVGYGKKEVLSGIDLYVNPGEVVGVIGHNGAGKSTLLKALFGVIPLWGGQVSYLDDIVRKPDPAVLLSLGIAYAPQGNRVFTELTVRENLLTPCLGRLTASESASAVERVVAELPILKRKLRQRAGTLSGGEKQVLSLATAMMLSPRVLMLDEPSLGLSATASASALNLVDELRKQRGVSVLIVEQKVRELLRIAERVYILRSGGISFSGAASDLGDENRLREAYL